MKIAEAGPAVPANGTMPVVRRYDATGIGKTRMMPAVGTMPAAGTMVQDYLNVGGRYDVDGWYDATGLGTMPAAGKMPTMIFYITPFHISSVQVDVI